MKRVGLPESLESHRIALRRHSLVWAATVFETIDVDRTRLSRFLPWVSQTRELAHTQEYFRSCAEGWDARDFFDFSIFLKEGETYVGNIGVHTIAWDHDRCEIGYWISSRYEGLGYVTEAVRILEAALFGAGFHRIEIHCSTSNERSAGVPRRAGFREEASLRECLVEEGAYRGTLIFGKLSTD
jgi:ribosomal-protein-serine acetyltransferase